MWYRGPGDHFLLEVQLNLSSQRRVHIVVNKGGVVKTLRRSNLGKAKNTVKVGSWSAVKPPSRRSHNRTLFCQKRTRSNFRGACEKVLLEGRPNRILGFSDNSLSRSFF